MSLKSFIEVLIKSFASTLNRNNSFAKNILSFYLNLWLSALFSFYVFGAYANIFPANEQGQIQWSVLNLFLSTRFENIRWASTIFHGMSCVQRFQGLFEIWKYSNVEILSVCLSLDSTYADSYIKYITFKAWMIAININTRRQYSLLNNSLKLRFFIIFVCYSSSDSHVWPLEANLKPLNASIIGFWSHRSQGSRERKTEKCIE